MQKFKIRVKNSEHSEKIQNKLFELGYKWNSGGKTIQHTDKPFLYVNDYDENGITFSTALIGECYFDSMNLSEVELIEKIEYEFKEIPKKNVVKIGENSYYEDELNEALKNIKPISK